MSHIPSHALHYQDLSRPAGQSRAFAAPCADRTGLEPVTPSLTSWCATRCANDPCSMPRPTLPRRVMPRLATSDPVLPSLTVSCQAAPHPERPRLSGDRGTRTPNLLPAGQLLYPLSHIPKFQALPRPGMPRQAASRHARKVEESNPYRCRYPDFQDQSHTMCGTFRFQALPRHAKPSHASPCRTSPYHA